MTKDEFSVVEQDSNITPETSNCEQCGAEFKYRKNKAFCGDTCRKAAKRAQDKKSGKAPTQSDKYRNAYITDMAMRCADEYYTLPFKEREAYVLHVIACSFQSTATRDMLTSQHLIKPKLDRTNLFRNRDPQNYLTIAEIVNRYCKIHHKTDTYKLMKEKRALSHKGVDMSNIDNRHAYKESEYKVVAEQEIDERMEGRKQWVIDYYKQVMGVRKEEMKQAA